MSLLKLENVGKIYVSESSVAVGMRGVDLEFDIGEFVAVTGKSGSGKTTLLNVISGMDTYEEGELYVAGAPTSHYSQADWERYRSEYVSFIFQEYNILESFTVLENVELALSDIEDRGERRRRALELIERVGLTRFKNHKGSKLSGGQKQRTVIARALAKDSPIILADEPTGNLDSKTSEEIIALLAEISREKLVIVVTHSFSQLAPYATREIRIYDGAVEKDEHLKEANVVTYERREKPKSKRRFSDLFRGIELGAHRFAAVPKLSVFTSLIMIIAMLGAFFTTAFTVTDLAVYEKNYMFSNMPGRVVAIRKDGAAIEEEELAELAATVGADSYIYRDSILDAKINYHFYTMDGDDMKTYSQVLRFVRDNTIEPDIGRKPEADGEAMLVLPIEWRDVFGKDELLMDSVDLYNNGSFILKLTGVAYYLDNSEETGKIVVTDNGLQYMYEIHNLFGESAIKEAMATWNVTTANGFQYDRYYKFYRFAVDSSLTGKSYYMSYDGSSTPMVLNDLASGATLNYSELGISVKTFLGAGVRYVQLYGTFESEKCFQATRGTSTLYVSQELARELGSVGAKTNYQSSLFFESTKLARTKCELISENGYVAVSADSTYSDPESLLYAAVEALIAFAIWVLVLRFIAFFLSICSQRAMLAKQGDIAILRSMGISVRVVKISMYTQMALSTVPSLLLLLTSCLVIYRSPSLNPVLPYLHALQYILICLGVVFLNVLITRRYNKKMFNESVRKTLKGGAK